MLSQVEVSSDYLVKVFGLMSLTNEKKWSKWMVLKVFDQFGE